MYAKIYRPEPSAMTSGRAHLDQWILEFTSNTPTMIDPLTGNARSIDTREQLDMKFVTLESAVAYAKANNIPHRIINAPTSRGRIRRSYADNFAYDRKLPWTH
ncbi:NADH dehydrogenase ubiquinone Fe-S protein 4 [uncultured Kiloniella sp.]|uniref:NADH dehydrogenase ubiquinone Fe-S protein 4 n=1 Tax=uncultured Kiloniella sp. TaxID=1133091 RepID=UPI00260E5230|nr:NADH dehydrogenase ubiquinone Fe-S protein 4 [uncultured Kiloniella sp.]